MSVAELLERNGLTDSFPNEVEAEVVAILANPGIEDATLVDRTDLPFITIDNDDSKDLDQAMCIRPGRDGRGFVVHYALADASYYTRPETALFKEALRRGASYYLPGFSVPMLPRALSENIVSINEGVERRSLLMSIELDAGGRIEKTIIERARVMSRKKLTYRGVQKYFDDGKSGPLAGQEFTETLDLLQQVGLLRIRDAIRRDVVVYHRQESEISFADPERTRLVLKSSARLEVERWNEQISLLTNAEAGKFLVERGSLAVQAIYRIHPAPPPERLLELQRWIGRLVELRALDAKFWVWRRARDGGGEPLSDYVARLPTSGRDVRVAAAIQRRAMLVNVSSMFAAEPGLHFGVGAQPYARASAPMREIVGIFTHKEMLEKQFGGGEANEERDERLRNEVVAAGNHAKELQKALDKESYKTVIDQILEGDVTFPLDTRPARTGTVIGVSMDKVYIELDDPPIEVKLYVRDLEREWRTELRVVPEDIGLAEKSRMNRPLLLAGDAIVLRARGYDRGQRRWMFDVIG